MTPLRAVLSAALRGTGPFAEICAFPLTNPRPELVEVATPIVLDAAEGEKRLDDVPSVSQTGVLRNEREPNNYSFKSGRARARDPRRRLSFKVWQKPDGVCQSSRSAASRRDVPAVCLRGPS